MASQIQSSVERVDSDSLLKHYFLNLRLIGTLLTAALTLDDHAHKEHFLVKSVTHDVLCIRNDLLFGQIRKNKYIYKELVQLASVLTKKEAFCRHLVEERADWVLDLFASFQTRPAENIVSRFELAVLHDVVECLPRSILENGAARGQRN